MNDIRTFTEAQKRRAYERQGHKCPCCVKNGIDTEYAYNEMQGDHIIPRSQGGRTIDSNLQMLCQKCNNDKSNQQGAIMTLKFNFLLFLKIFVF